MNLNYFLTKSRAPGGGQLLVFPTDPAVPPEEPEARHLQIPSTGGHAPSLEISGKPTIWKTGQRVFFLNAEIFEYLSRWVSQFSRRNPLKRPSW